MSDAVVIVGAGQAGGLVAAGLAMAGYPGPVTVVGAEQHAPYQRPPLSKAYLTGAAKREALLLKPAEFYAQKGVLLCTGVQASAIDRHGARLELSDGTALPYHWLVLCTGARARSLPVPGAELPGVFTLRTLDDSDRIAAALQPGSRLVIIGGGYVGLELAAAAVKLGARATVLEQAPRVLARTASPDVSAHFTALHRAAGVEIVTGVQVAALAGGEHVRGVESSDGRRWPADLVVAGVGALPEQSLAEAAGIPCDDGILVDERCRTAYAQILAAGDCTRHPNPLLGRSLRLESVHNATGQARTVVAEIMGRPKPYSEVPWFWSDQYEARLQIAGMLEPDGERLVRGDPASGSFSVLHLKEGRLQALEAVNRPQDFLAAKRLIGEGVAPDPAALLDTELPLYPTPAQSSAPQRTAGATTG